MEKEERLVEYPETQNICQDKGKRREKRMRYFSIIIWSMFLILSVSTSGWAAATAQGVALSADTDCSEADLDITLITVDAHREYGLVTLLDGTVLQEFDHDTGLKNFNGTYVGYGLSFPSAQLPGKVIGSYAYIGETPPNASDTAEFFILYNCSTREVLYQCFGPYGVCPQRANNLREGTIGTEMTITGSGFEANKGKVLVGTAPLKILEWTDSSIQCQLTRALSPGTYDVTIRPRKLSPIILGDSFTAIPPDINSTEPTSGSTGDEITIKGLFFGTKKGKVTLGGKTCKVLKWEMNSTTGESEIQFVVPKRLDPGTYDLIVSTTKVGSGTTNFTVE